MATARPPSTAGRSPSTNASPAEVWTRGWALPAGGLVRSSANKASMPSRPELRGHGLRHGDRGSLPGPAAASGLRLSVIHGGRDALSVGGFEPVLHAGLAGPFGGRRLRARLSLALQLLSQPGFAVSVRALAGLRWADLRARWRTRISLLDGLVFSGGEPRSDPALPSAWPKCVKAVWRHGAATAGVSAAHEPHHAATAGLGGAGHHRAAPQPPPALTGAPGSVRNRQAGAASWCSSQAWRTNCAPWHPAVAARACAADAGRLAGVARRAQAGRPPGGRSRRLPRHGAAR